MIRALATSMVFIITVIIINIVMFNITIFEKVLALRSNAVVIFCDGFKKVFNKLIIPHLKWFKPVYCANITSANCSAHEGEKKIIKFNFDSKKTH